MIIVVITGYLKYSVEGYKIQAARYLLKPVNAQLLYSELDEVLSLDDQQTLVLEERDTYHRIKRRDILYVETMGRGTRFHTPEGTFESRESLSIWEQRLDAALFVECHKGILVHVRRIVSIQNRWDRQSLRYSRMDRQSRAASKIRSMVIESQGDMRIRKNPVIR